MSFTNAYDDAQMAASYSRLEFPATYYLAYRDLPKIFTEHITGRQALDFGCGAGRSTRFVRACGFEVTGVDIAESMLRQAKTIDPDGDYRLMKDGDFTPLAGSSFDLILSAFTFDNVPTLEKKVAMFSDLGKLLRPGGRIVNLVSSPQIYLNEWASFTTAGFPENREARAGDIVRIINTAIDDRRPVEDIIWPDDAYRDVFARAGLEVVATYNPLGSPDEPYEWVNETHIAPWTIYVLGR